MSYSNGEAKAIALLVTPSGNKKADVLSFLQEFMSITEYSPSLDEICDAVDTLYPRNAKTSKSMADWYLTELEKSGDIELPRRNGRRITAGRIILNNEGVARQDTN